MVGILKDEREHAKEHITQLIVTKDSLFVFPDEKI